MNGPSATAAHEPAKELEPNEEAKYLPRRSNHNRKRSWKALENENEAMYRAKGGQA